MSAASGNLFAMTDPFRMVLALDRPGPDYEVWDEAAGIEWWRLHAKTCLPGSTSMTSLGAASPRSRLR